MEDLSQDRRQWLPKILQHGSSIPIVLVGCKLDLREDPAVVAQLRAASQSPVATEQVEHVPVLTPHRSPARPMAGPGIRAQDRRRRLCRVLRSDKKRCPEHLAAGGARRPRLHIHGEALAKAKAEAKLHRRMSIRLSVVSIARSVRRPRLLFRCRRRPSPCTCPARACRADSSAGQCSACARRACTIPCACVSA
jgi:hypothetical protein